MITSKDEDFSLQKYFVSFYKIKNDEKFKGADLKDFSMCTNADFDLTSKNAERQNKKYKKDKRNKFLADETELKRDDILYFEGQQGKEVRFKNDGEIIADLTTEIKSALKENMKEADRKASNLIETSAEKKIKLSDLKKAYDNFGDNIKEFVEKFRFVIVIFHPNVNKLNTLIGDEVGKDFKLLDPDLVTDSFQKDILDWFKEKVGILLTKRNSLAT